MNIPEKPVAFSLDVTCSSKEI